jgi:hypothetical protein
VGETASPVAIVPCPRLVDVWTLAVSCIVETFLGVLICLNSGASRAR